MKLSSIKIIKTLRAAGFEAYWAGGCVRDMLLGVHPKDFDIATSARPDDIKKLFKKIIPVGEQFGVLLTEQDSHHFEVATFRSDSGYTDGRRPDAVLFTNAREDALRRDFTINGMFYDPIEDKILDFVGGQEDLKNELIRFIGDPNERILEDHLRIIRAVRFKNTLGFQYHPDTYEALKKYSELANKVSGERVRDELNRMIEHDSFPQSFMDMEDLGILKSILPEVQAMKGIAQPPEYHQEGDVWDHTVLAIKALKSSASLIVRWAVFLHDIGKTVTFKIKERIRFDHHSEKSGQIAGKILRRLHFSSRDTKIIQWLVSHHMMVYNVLDMPLARRRHWFLDPWYLDLLEVNRCDTMGTVPVRLDTYEKVLALYRKEMKEMPHEPERLLIGEEIMKMMDTAPGPIIGEILDAIRMQQLEKKLTTKAAAKEWVKKNYG